MQWFYITWEIIVNGIESSLFIYLLMHQLEYNSQKRPYIIYGILLRAFWLTFLNFIVINTTCTLILMLFFDISYAAALFRSNTGRKVLWGCGYVIIALFADNLTFWFASNFTHFQLQDLIIPGKIRFLMTLVYLLTCTMGVYVLSHWRKKDLFLPVSFRITLSLLMCLGIITSDQLLSIIISASITGNDLFINHLEMISYSFLFILFSFVLFIEYLGVVTRQNETLRNEAAINALKREHYETITTAISALRTWKHDYKTHLQVILALAKEGKTQKLEEYISSLETDLVNTSHMVSTDNQILDALMSTKILEFQKYSIKFSYEVFLVKSLPFNDIIFASLIGNLLQNALDACRNMKDHQDKYIAFCIKPFHEMIYIKVENSTANQYAYHPDGTLKTTKKDDGHGLGLKRVKEIVSDAKGFCTISPEPDKFAVVIMLPLPDHSHEVDYGN